MTPPAPSGPPLNVTTAEAGATTQPTPSTPSVPLGVRITQSKTNAYAWDPHSASQPALREDQPPSLVPIAFDVPPLPGVSPPASPPLEGSPFLLGSTVMDDGYQEACLESAPEKKGLLHTFLKKCRILLNPDR